MTHITCRLTAKNRDQLRNLALGNRVWATFFFTFLIILTGTSGLPFTRADLLPAVPHKEEKIKAMTEDAEPIRSKIVPRRDTTAAFFMLNTLAALNDARNVPIIGTSPL